MEALEIEQRLHHPQAGGIAIGDRDDVGAERRADRRVARRDVVVDLADQGARRIGMVEPVGDAVDDRAFQRLVIEHRAGQERRQHRIVARGVLRFDANAREQRIVVAEADHPGRRLLRHSEPP